MSKPYNWKLFFVVWAAAIFGLLALQPYARALLEAAGPAQPQPWTTVALGLLIGAIQVGAYALIGLWLANRIGLGLPIVEAALRREPVGQKIRLMLPISIVLGLVGGLLIVGLDAFVFQPAMMAELRAAGRDVEALQQSMPGAWQGFLASFYGGIDEEIFLRLFMMSLLAWLGHFASKTADGRPTTAVLWTANVLAALLFGLLHLPATAAVIPLTPVVIARALALNGLLGIAYGWLYMKHGLESAMLAHFSSDLVLHVIFAA